MKIGWDDLDFVFKHPSCCFYKEMLLSWLTMKRQGEYVIKLRGQLFYKILTNRIYLKVKLYHVEWKKAPQPYINKFDRIITDMTYINVTVKDEDQTLI